MNTDKKRLFKLEMVISPRAKVVVVTGAESGLGYESAKFLIRTGAKVYAVCQDSRMGERAVMSLNSLPYKGKAILLQCDFSDLITVQRVAAEILARERHIHIVFANLGWTRSTYSVSDRWIYRKANNLGLYYLLHLLKPALSRAASQSIKDSVRVILMSSSGFFSLRNKTVLHGWESNHCTELTHYGDKASFAQCNLLNVYETPDVANALRSNGILVAILHLESLRSEFWGYAPLYQRVVLNKILGPLYFGSTQKITYEFEAVNGHSGNDRNPSNNQPDASLSEIDAHWPDVDPIEYSHGQRAISPV